MGKKMAVLGTGAIGSSIGADLTLEGRDVLLIDQWPAHVEAMKASGLRVSMPGQELHAPVRAAHLCELATLRQQLDIVFLSAKSYDTRWLVQLIKPYLKADGVLVSTQNSLNDEWIAPILGYERVIGCALELSAEVFEPGRVKRNTDPAHTRFVVGEPHGRITPRLDEVAGILSAAGKTEMTANIWGAKWSKLAANTFMAFEAACDLHVWEIPQNPRYLRMCIKLGREAAEVGKALGYVMEPLFGLSAEEFLGATDEGIRALLMKLIGDVGEAARSCVKQDLIKGRQTEVDYLNGLVVAKGRQAGVPTPLNEALTDLMRQIEQGKLKPDRANAELLERHA